MPTTSEATAMVADKYVVLENTQCQPDCVVDAIAFVYEESNGMPGLQRSDERKDDTCGGHIEADSIFRPA